MTAGILTSAVLVIALAASSLPVTAYASSPTQKTRLPICRDNYASNSANVTCTEERFSEAAPQEAYGQSGGTRVLLLAEESFGLTRSERRRFQMALAKEGFDPGPTDGLFGRGIRGANRAWRGSRGKPARMLLAAGEKSGRKSSGKQQSGNASVERVDAANEILRDKYVLGLSKALKADDYPKALAFIDKLQELGGDLPPAIDYFRGEAYFHTKRYIKADKALNRYLSKTGKKGRYYRKSLELLLTTEEKIQGLPNEKDKHGNTALHRAARENDHEVVPKLIALGIDVNAKNTDGWTPLHTTASKKTREVAALLIRAGADVNARTAKGSTPLRFAALANAGEVASLLIKSGADVNAKNKGGFTPLTGAAWINAGQVAALLIEAGADVNAKTAKGSTPLHYAARKNAREVAVLLIEAGADVNAKDKDRATPLRLARDPAVKALLRRYGARE